MHGYSTDSDEKRVVPLILAGLAIALAWMSSNLLATEHFSMPWWMDAPSSMFFYGALYALFDGRLWRHPLMRKLGLVKTLNLAGRWQGYLTFSFDNHAKHYRFMRANRPELDANFRLPQYRHVCLVELRGSDSSLRSRRRRADLPI
jgi:SMODS-associating 2TM, beta-strand rich effector domain